MQQQGAPQQWRPGMGGGGAPPNTTPGDDEGDSGDEGPGQEKVTFGDINIAGYNNMGPVGQMMVLPPPPPPPPPSGPPPDMRFTEISVMDEAACRDAVVNYAAENCCYGSAPAKEMTFNSVEPKTALHYTLETYGENRSTGYKTVPYPGGPVDGPQNGPAPPPWAMPCEPDQLFKDQIKLIEVPHTSFVKQCHSCHGMGWRQCGRCHGRGRVRCTFCHGSGRRQRRTPEGVHWENCHYCHGGMRSCHRCGGDGRVTCGTCDGFGQLRAYIELKVTYTNHLNDYIMEQTDMPDELVREVGGKPVFEQTLPQVWPIMAYPVREVNENSQNLVNMHRSSFNDERKHMQRQVLRAVPVTEVTWTWKEYRSKRLWVYGNEHKVYCPDYPQTCCWGCEIL